MYSRLKLLVRRASRVIFGIKGGTEKRAGNILFSWGVINTEYFSDNLKILSTYNFAVKLNKITQVLKKMEKQK